VIHYASPSFWETYQQLPAAVRELADRCFQRMKSDPRHPSLHFKKVGRYWSARVGRQYRVLGVETNDGILWFWIGTHAEYNHLLGSSAGGI
jgi:hypothetical protein